MIWSDILKQFNRRHFRCFISFRSEVGAVRQSEAPCFWISTIAFIVNVDSIFTSRDFIGMKTSWMNMIPKHSNMHSAPSDYNQHTCRATFRSLTSTFLRHITRRLRRALARPSPLCCTYVKGADARPPSHEFWNLEMAIPDLKPGWHLEMILHLGTPSRDIYHLEILFQISRDAHFASRDICCKSRDAIPRCHPEMFFISRYHLRNFCGWDVISASNYLGSHLEMIIPDNIPRCDLEMLIPENISRCDLEMMSPGNDLGLHLEMMIPDIIPRCDLEMLIPENISRCDLEMMSPGNDLGLHLEMMISYFIPRWWACCC